MDSDELEDLLSPLVGQAFDEKLHKRVSELLRPMLGDGAEARVSIDVDFAEGDVGVAVGFEVKFK